MTFFFCFQKWNAIVKLLFYLKIFFFHFGMQSIEWSEKCAKNYQGGEGMDQHRERAYQTICLQYHQMANQYFVKHADKVTDEVCMLLQVLL